MSLGKSSFIIRGPGEVGIILRGPGSNFKSVIYKIQCLHTPPFGHFMRM